MDKKVDWNLLAKYLFDECSEEEAAEVEVWLQEDPKRETLLEELRIVRRMTRDSPSPRSWDTKALWSRVQKRTQKQEARDEPTRPAVELPAQSSNPRASAGKSRRRRARRLAHSRTTQSFASKAAVIGALVFAAVVAFWLEGDFEGESNTASAPETQMFTTEEGQRATVRLTDGTRVRLNVDSRLTVQASFGKGERKVQLDGEAFFEVAKDSTRPFIVRTGEVTTHVLGTAFNVSTYPKDRETRVLVTEGQVALRAEELPPDEPLSAWKDGQGGVVLTERQMGRVLRSGERVVHRELDVSQHLAWMEGQLVFEEASFEKVVRKLERWYALTVTLEEGMAPPSGHLNAQFAEDQPLHEVLSVIATAFGLEYEHHQKRVTFAHPKASGSP